MTSTHTTLDRNIIIKHQAAIKSPKLEWHSNAFSRVHTSANADDPAKTIKQNVG